MGMSKSGLRILLAIAALPAVVQAAPAKRPPAAKAAIPRTFSARAGAIREDTSRGDLILALANGDTTAAEADGRGGSPFGLVGLVNQRAYLKSHLATLRHYCEGVEAVAPRSLLNRGNINFTGSGRRGTAKYWISEGDMNAESAYQDAVIVVEEVGCANVVPYAATIHKYLNFNRE
jgi:hypothetical protein